MQKENFLNRTIDFIFSNDPRKYLILILILGAILRFIAVENITPIADEMVHGSHAIGIIGSHAISHQNECPVWFYLTDIAYKIFGVNAFSARFLSFFFGLLTIIIIYMIAKRIFNSPKIALISAFILAVSSYYIRYALMEMDEAMMFFVLLSFYLFIKGLDKQKVSYLTFVFISVAVLIKPIALTFIPGFVLYFIFLLYKEKDKEKRHLFLKDNYKPIILGSLMFLIFMSPVLVYNYLLFKEKGISDIIFARFFGISPEIYSSLSGGAGQKFMFSAAINPGLKWLASAFWGLDPVISILGLIGIFSVFLFSKNRLARFFVLFHLIPLIFLLSTQLLETHFVIFIVPLAFSLAYLSDKISPSKKILYIFLIFILVTSTYILMASLTSQSAIFKGRSFAVDSVKENDIVITDARIYRGTAVFMFYDKHYLESSYFGQLDQTLKNISGTGIPIKTYFIECAVDDCGWGTIYQQPEFNQSTEDFVALFKNNSQKIMTIYAGSEERVTKDLKSPYFNIYATTLYLKPQVYQLIDSTHEWFYYPVMWKGERYDKYALDTFPKILLHNFAYAILWLAIAIAILSPIFLIHELSRET